MSRIAGGLNAKLDVAVFVEVWEDGDAASAARHSTRVLPVSGYVTLLPGHDSGELKAVLNVPPNFIWPTAHLRVRFSDPSLPSGTEPPVELGNVTLLARGKVLDLGAPSEPRYLEHDSVFDLTPAGEVRARARDGSRLELTNVVVNSDKARSVRLKIFGVDAAGGSVLLAEPEVRVQPGRNVIPSVVASIRTPDSAIDFAHFFVRAEKLWYPPDIEDRIYVAVEGTLRRWSGGPQPLLTVPWEVGEAEATVESARLAPRPNVASPLWLARRALEKAGLAAPSSEAGPGPRATTLRTVPVILAAGLAVWLATATGLAPSGDLGGAGSLLPWIFGGFALTFLPVSIRTALKAARRANARRATLYTAPVAVVAGLAFWVMWRFGGATDLFGDPARTALFLSTAALMLFSVILLAAFNFLMQRRLAADSKAVVAKAMSQARTNLQEIPETATAGELFHYLSTDHLILQSERTAALIRRWRDRALDDPENYLTAGFVAEVARYLMEGPHARIAAAEALSAVIGAEVRPTDLSNMTPQEAAALADTFEEQLPSPSLFLINLLYGLEVLAGRASLQERAVRTSVRSRFLTRVRAFSAFVVSVALGTSVWIAAFVITAGFPGLAFGWIAGIFFITALIPAGIYHWLNGPKKVAGSAVTVIFDPTYEAIQDVQEGIVNYLYYATHREFDAGPEETRGGSAFPAAAPLFLPWWAVAAVALTLSVWHALRSGYWLAFLHPVPVHKDLAKAVDLRTGGHPLARFLDGARLAPWVTGEWGKAPNASRADLERPGVLPAALAGDRAALGGELGLTAGQIESNGPALDDIAQLFADLNAAYLRPARGRYEFALARAALSLGALFGALDPSFIRPASLDRQLKALARVGSATRRRDRAREEAAFTLLERGPAAARGLADDLAVPVASVLPLVESENYSGLDDLLVAADLSFLFDGGRISPASPLVVATNVAPAKARAYLEGCLGAAATAALLGSGALSLVDLRKAASSRKKDKYIVPLAAVLAARSPKAALPAEVRVLSTLEADSLIEWSLAGLPRGAAGRPLLVRFILLTLKGKGLEVPFESLERIGKALRRFSENA